MKLAPVVHALDGFQQIQQTIVHTGQHYDRNMSDVFFEQLGIPEPDVNLEVGSGSHAFQTAHIMLRLEEMLIKNSPDRVLVYGDVNSTVATAMVCAKLLIPIDHVEAGLRSGDRTMPEEVNRIVTDRLASLLFTPSEDGNENLIAEGVKPEQIHLVGNVMIDTLVRMLSKVEGIQLSVPTEYVLVTLHRPSNTDDLEVLHEILTTLSDIASDIPVIFPIHPRTRSRLSSINFDVTAHPKLNLWDPVGYLEFLYLQKHAKLVITDSGGIQEETTYMQIPCLTVRENTERPVTVTMGTNMLVGQNMATLRSATREILQNGRTKHGQIPPLWDGKAGERIASILVQQGI
ncbi:MAG: UDP-N-acetylglucosamine 2-epimerase (non-hydrolyzing) [Anaerolineae bacterium]|nr:UDP-N-acetylglucosamine 2-epimerase (non-hydrolyzing) [Anaerolineae bacterium]